MFLQKLTNGLLFIYFLFITIVAPLFDGQTILPIEFFPKLLIDLKSNYAQENNDYLISEKPHFFVGLVWVELLLQWPLCMANLYGILNKKSWVKNTCLIYGVSTATGMYSGIFILMNIFNKVNSNLPSLPLNQRKFLYPVSLTIKYCSFYIAV
ncbi:hypothetical protein MKW94_009781 [Papaver nudicaule]|uniref:EXPERA domain-containing protein n=1 Tax=Papaver nudicaule TaxID=74823 RepID=A0AA41V4G7_PAPNU|nr:hypothetical protein [Papaver nudicaule]